MVELAALFQQCAPQVAPSTLYAIARTESGFDPLALRVNGKVGLQRKPRSKEEAIAWAEWLVQRGYSVDMGLMQINSANLRHLRVSPAAMFDPCENVKAGAAILSEQYRRALRTHGDPSAALLKALSAYNTGSFERGFANGYVAKVVNGHGRQQRASATSGTRSGPPLVAVATAASPLPMQAHHADSAIEGFNSVSSVQSPTSQ